MNAITIFWVPLFFALAFLYSCDQRQPRAMVIHTDADTGCQYVSLDRGGALTPRLSPDGRQMGCGAPKPAKPAPARLL